jgi:hypothetical protein
LAEPGAISSRKPATTLSSKYSGSLAGPSGIRPRGGERDTVWSEISHVVEER